MDNSLENIWKEGFLKEDALVAPKINDLYNQKSQHLIDKMMRMYRINLLIILGFAIGVFIIATLAGHIYHGLVISLLCSALVFISRKQMEKLEEIDKSSSSYEYLKRFKECRQEIQALFTNVYRVFYPLFLLAMMSLIWVVTINEEVLDKLMRKFPDLHFTLGVPTFLFIGVIVFAGFMSIFAKKLYEWDIEIVYGRVFQRLDEMLEDMEELRA